MSRCGCGSVSLLALVVPRLSSLSWPELELVLGEDDEGDGGLLFFALRLASVVGSRAALLFEVVERVLATSGVLVASRRGLGFGVPPLFLGASSRPVFGSVFSGTVVEVVLARAGRVGSSSVYSCCGERCPWCPSPIRGSSRLLRRVCELLPLAPCCRADRRKRPGPSPLSLSLSRGRVLGPGQKGRSLEPHCLSGAKMATGSSSPGHEGSVKPPGHLAPTICEAFGRLCVPDYLAQYMFLWDTLSPMTAAGQRTGTYLNTKRFSWQTQYT